MELNNQFVCFLCGKKVDVQKYEVHVSFCTGKGTSKPLIDPSQISLPGPQAIQCYICKKPFLKGSIDIHLKACQKAWEKCESQKPADQRKPVPKPPKGYEEMKKKMAVAKPVAKSKIEEGPIYNPYEDDQFIADSFKEWMAKALVPCQKCGRKFLPERFSTHLKSCTGPDPIKKTKPQPARK